MASAAMVSLATVAEEVGVPAVKRQIGEFAASGQLARAAVVRWELWRWQRREQLALRVWAAASSMIRVAGLGRASEITG